MANKHTKGPYKTSTLKGADLVQIQNAAGEGVALTDGRHAALFAAAPDMLETLKRVLLELSASPETKEWGLVRRVSNTIARVEGEAND